MTTYTYTILSDPSAAPGGSTNPVAINNKGQIAGYYFNGTAQVGFLYSKGTWTTLSDPAAGPNGSTVPISMNDKGQIIGYTYDGTTYVGFLYSNGKWTTLNDPSAHPSSLGLSTIPSSINDRGQVVGGYYNGTISESFLYSNGSWTTLNDPAAGANGSTSARAINDKGEITGSFGNRGGPTSVGFLYSNGTWTTLIDPSVGANETTDPTSINDRGQVVGYTNDGFKDVGFLYSNGTWTTLKDPSASTLTVPRSINDSGQVIGSYFFSSPAFTNVGFLYSKGTFTDLSIPHVGSVFANPQSINDNGQITGYYSFSNGTGVEVGFIATPTDIDNAREPPKLTITDHWLSATASGSVLLPISMKANDRDDTVSIKISGVASFETITAGDGHAVAKMGDSYTFTLSDVQSGLTLHSSFERKYHPEHDGREHGQAGLSEHRLAAEQSKLTVTAVNTTHGEYAAATPQTITVTTASPVDRFAGLFNQYVAAGFHHDRDGAGQMISPDKQGHQENLAFLSNPHH